MKIEIKNLLLEGYSPEVIVESTFRSRLNAARQKTLETGNNIAVGALGGGLVGAANGAMLGGMVGAVNSSVDPEHLPGFLDSAGSTAKTFGEIGAGVGALGMGLIGPTTKDKITR